MQLSATERLKLRMQHLRISLLDAFSKKGQYYQNIQPVLVLM